MNKLFVFLSRPEILILITFWSVFWKGWALWKSANKKQLIWFIILLIINTIGILEILYIFIFNRYNLDKGKLLKYLETKFKKI